MRDILPSKRYFLLICFFLVAGYQLNAQHYIYIQSENSQPFYIKLNGSAYGSNNTGYLLVPQLVNGEYTITMGIPRSTVEYNFMITLKDDDRGFSLKQAVDNTWSLFDIVNFSVIKSVQIAVTAKNTEKELPKKEAEETKKLSEEPKIEPVIAVKEVVKDIPADAPKAAMADKLVTNAVLESPEKTVVKTELMVTGPAPDPVRTAVIRTPEPVVAPVIAPKQANGHSLKIFERSSADGVDQVYVVQNGNKRDTVIIFIPNIKEELPKVAGKLSRLGRSAGSPQDLNHLYAVKRRVLAMKKAGDA